MMPGAAIDTVTGAIVTAGGDGVLLTASLRDGSKLRESGMGAADGMSSIRIDETGTVIVGAASDLESYSSRTGRVNWSFHARNGLRALGDIPVALHDSIVFTTGTRNYGMANAYRALPIRTFLSLLEQGARREKLSSVRGWFREQWLMALDRRNGDVLWQEPLGIGLSVPRNQSGTPVVVGATVLVSSPVSRTVWAFNASDGRLLWKRPLTGMHKGAVTVHGSDVFFGDSDGKITFLNVATGAVTGTCVAPGAFSATAPIVVGRTVIAATRDGSVWAAPFDSIRTRAAHQRPCTAG
jgi:outer membrane protein assembly factor BamB